MVQHLSRRALGVKEAQELWGSATPLSVSGGRWASDILAILDEGCESSTSPGLTLYRFWVAR